MSVSLYSINFIMTSQQEREALKKAYSGKKWARRVDGMSDAQVHAIFLNLKKQDKV